MGDMVRCDNTSRLDCSEVSRCMIRGVEEGVEGAWFSMRGFLGRVGIFLHVVCGSKIDGEARSIVVCNSKYLQPTYVVCNR